MISEQAKDMGDFLEKVLPLRALASLTTLMQMSQNEFDYVVREWLRGVQAHNRWLTIGWIRAYEYKVRRHAHLALVAAAPLDCIHAENLWRKLTRRKYQRGAVVKPFSKGVAGLGYISSVSTLQLKRGLIMQTG
jgi:hypothetical protein